MNQSIVQKNVDGIEAGLRLTDDEADALRTRVHSIADEIAARCWEAGQILYRISGDRSHVRRWGFRSWTDWAERELGIEKRKAQQLRLLYDYFFVRCPIPPDLAERLVSIPWTKARLLVGRVSAGDAEHWIRAAESSSREELEAVVRGQTERASPNRSIAGGRLLEGDDEREYRESVRFDLFHTEGSTDSQFAIFTLAVDQAARLTGSRKLGHLVTLICTDFVATNDFLGNAKEDRLRLLHSVAQQLGFAVVVVDSSTGRLVSGLDTLERMQAAHVGSDATVTARAEDEAKGPDGPS